MLGLDGLLAQKCILLVKWEKNVSRLLTRSRVEFIVQHVGESNRRPQTTRYMGIL